jgi:hypothetical protein
MTELSRKVPTIGSHAKQKQVMFDVFTARAFTHRGHVPSQGESLTLCKRDSKSMISLLGCIDSARFFAVAFQVLCRHFRRSP